MIDITLTILSKIRKKYMFFVENIKVYLNVANFISLFWFICYTLFCEVLIKKKIFKMKYILFLYLINFLFDFGMNIYCI